MEEAGMDGIWTRHLCPAMVWGFVLSVAVGCAGAAEERYVAEDAVALPAVDTTAERARPAESSRAAEVEGFLTIEGMREPMMFRLFRSPRDFPLDFETYLPADVEAEPVGSGGGDAVAFVPTFGGERGSRARLAITVPEGERSAPEAQRLVREIAGAMGAAERVSSGGYSWALEEHRFRSGDLVGSVALGRHDGTYFYVTTAYPAEMGDGFGARVARILGEWRWADGSRLGS
jgi:hypothetical protein